MYPQPLYIASQVRTTSRSWDKGVLTDLCLTRVLTDLCLTCTTNTHKSTTNTHKIQQIHIRYNKYTHSTTNTHVTVSNRKPRNTTYICVYRIVNIILVCWATHKRRYQLRANVHPVSTRWNVGKFWLYLNYSLTAYSTVLLQKLTGSQLIQKFPTFYGTQSFITAFTSARQLSLSNFINNQQIYRHTTPSTHHLHSALKLNTSLHQASLRKDQIILTPKILITIHF